MQYLILTRISRSFNSLGNVAYTAGLIQSGRWAIDQVTT